MTTAGRAARGGEIAACGHGFPLQCPPETLAARYTIFPRGSPRVRGESGERERNVRKCLPSRALDGHGKQTSKPPECTSSTIIASSLGQPCETACRERVRNPFITLGHQITRMSTSGPFEMPRVFGRDFSNAYRGGDNEPRDDCAQGC
ncbi:PREDICTED: uncharacterized protein LOC105454172 [Wasmannia auropunctata]|uniref:uncharacterized protein LOC105454172 n=1 Tax=Wasmannia auropunctata TaxID=64793 RepID=UPI0005EE7152|nr:PREDICTED: uncharacterized protein LOC105454172 [Wasmannia auropunctata]